jgi:anti-anti-sigma factor
MSEDLAGQDNATSSDSGVSLHTEWVEGVAVVHVHGEVDMTTAPAIEQELDAAIAELPPSAVVMDLTATTFLASRGLQVLMQLRERGARAGFAVRVVAASRVVRRAIELTGLDEELDLYDTVADALVEVPGQPR